MGVRNIEQDKTMFHLNLKLEVYKQQREDTRKIFDQAFVFSNNAARGLFIVSAGSAIALLNASIKEEARASIQCHIAYFTACAALCAICSGIAYVAQRLYTGHSYSVSDDIVSKLYSDSWPTSKRTKRFFFWAEFVNYIAISVFCTAAGVFCWRLFLIYRMVLDGKI